MHRLLLFIVAFAALCSVSTCKSSDSGLRDESVAGEHVQYLDGQWSLRSEKTGTRISITGDVPGDLLTDLQEAGVIGDPLYELNFKNASIWDDRVWVYSTAFEAQDQSRNGGTRVVFDGIKMGATIKLNGEVIGRASDQFLRYDLQVTLLRKNLLEVAFDPDVDVDGRFMACSGGWDWAPYTTTREGRKRTVGKATTFSKGIWKSVYVVYAPVVSIDYVVPQIFYLGQYPLERLQAGKHGDFVVNTTVHLSAPSSVQGKLCVQGEWGGVRCEHAVVPAGTTGRTLSLRVKAKEIDLWWPTGLGGQHLYKLNATFEHVSSVISTMRSVGFRYVALVTRNETDINTSERVEAEEGSGQHGMYLRVNGVPVWARGANMIPMEELEGRMSSRAHRVLVKSAVDAQMNMLRVWGGGVFLPQAWYDACDSFGVMVYHDMQYAQSGHSPKATPAQEQELKHQIRRLSAHPSIVIWDGCNECQVHMGSSTEIYASFVLKTVAEVDQSRPVWPSCPAIGWTSGVRTVDSLPNGTTKDRFCLYLCLTCSIALQATVWLPLLTVL